MKILLTLALAVIALAAFAGLGVAQENPVTQERKVDKKIIVETKPQVERWGSATLTMTDDKGITTTKTEKYPVIDKATVNTPDFRAATHEFNNCWDWCKNVCDGYGVCWLSCGTSCSPWWPKNEIKKSQVSTASGQRSCSATSGDGKKSCSKSCSDGQSASCSNDETSVECSCN